MTQTIIPPTSGSSPPVRLHRLLRGRVVSAKFSCCVALSPMTVLPSGVSDDLQLSFRGIGRFAVIVGVVGGTMSSCSDCVDAPGVCPPSLDCTDGFRQTGGASCVGRLLRPSRNGRGRRPAPPRDREPRAGRRAPLWPRDLSDDGGVRRRAAQAACPSACRAAVSTLTGCPSFTARARAPTTGRAAVGVEGR
jgi:hypothetical protein